MKTIIFSMLIILANTSYSQECDLSFNQLLKILDYNQSEFESFALKKDFSYNSNEQTYFCDKNLNKRNILSKYEESGITVLIYSFYKKKVYLNFKENLEAGDLTNTLKEEGILRYQYTYNDKIVIIQTSTYVDGSNTYMISISKNDFIQQ